MELLLIFVGPVLMIILSRKRIKGKIKLPIITAALLSIAANLFSSFAMAWIMMYQLSLRHVRCATGAVAGSIGFAMLDTIFIVISGIIASICYYQKLSKQHITVADLRHM